MAPEHIALWEWVDSLKRGVRPEAFLADWPRGYGKTTNMRLAMARMSVTVVRRFGLYICAGQGVANNHVNSIRRRFEEMGVARLEDKYGYSLGWNGARLRTANGFNLVALGLDQAGARGLNLDDLRPDFLVLDDIDDLNDSVDAADKKYGILTQTVLPAGSPDMAVLFGQNEIHGNSVMHKFVSGEADAMRRRVVSKVVAVEGLECRRVPPPPDSPLGTPDQYEIISGESTWPGKTVQQWQDDLNLYGELPFRRECQHELGAGGLFFRFSADVRDEATGEMVPWHVRPDMPEISPQQDVWGSHDYGTGAAACSHVWTADKWGVITVIAEEYREDRTSKQQALALLLLLWELGLGMKPPAERDEREPGAIKAFDKDGQEKPVTNRLGKVAFDYANTFPPMGKGAQTAIQRQGEYPIEVWKRYKIDAIPAVKDVIAGLENLKSWLARTVTYPADHPTMPGKRVPAFRIVQGRAPMLQAYLEKAIKDAKDSRLAVSAAKLEHAGDSGRYGCMYKQHRGIRLL